MKNENSRYRLSPQAEAFLGKKGACAYYLCTALKIVQSEDRCKESPSIEDMKKMYSLGKKEEISPELKNITNVVGNYLLKEKLRLLGQKDEDLIKETLFTINNPSPAIYASIDNYKTQGDKK